jgi:hypothetical protein
VESEEPAPDETKPDALNHHGGPQGQPLPSVLQENIKNQRQKTHSADARGVF